MKSLSHYATQIAIRLSKHQTGANIHGASDPLTGSSADLDGIDMSISGATGSASGASVEIHSDLSPIADNDDVWKVRFRKRGMTKLKRMAVKARRIMRRVLHYIMQLMSKEYSIDEKAWMLTHLHEWQPVELDDHRRAKEADRVFRFHREQARIVERQIINILTNLRFSDNITEEKRVRVRKRIKIDHTYVDAYSYTYVIQDTPYGVKKTEIAKDEIMTEIASSIGKKVRYELDLGGLRLIVEVGSTLSIPNFASFADFSKMPKSMPPLAFFLGCTTNGSPVFRDLADAPHMIVAGQTGGGKSNLLNGIICGYLLRQPPTTLKLILFDLKGGVEFAPFYGIPHLWAHEEDADGIIEYPEKIIPALEAILKECNKRLAILKKAKVRNVAEFNRGKHPKNRLPYLIGIFDEYTTARKLAGDKVETLLSTIANVSRAAGIHFIIGTQYPKSDVLSTLISVNFPWRIAFNMTTAASQSVLGSWDAFGLSPVGRAIFQSSDGQVFIQTPRITSSTISSIVSDVKSGTGGVTIRTVDPEELLEWALNNTGGKLDRDTLFNHFKDKITLVSLNDLLRSMERKQFEVHGTLYTVTPPAGSAARKMDLVSEAQIADDTTDNPQPTTEEA